jgi:hypothetical protein
VRTTFVDDSAADEVVRGEHASLSDALTATDVARIRSSATSRVSVSSSHGVRKKSPSS